MTHSEKTIRLVIIGIIGALFVTVVGSVSLAVMGKTIPEPITMLATTLAGGLLAMLSKTGTPPEA